MKMKCSDIKFKPPFALALFFFASLILLARSQYEDPKFNYDESTGRGPSNWGSLKTKWRNCSIGQRQSPINIQTVEVRPQLGDLQTNYSSADAVLRNQTIYVAVEWSGNAAGSITINGIVYIVRSCHWHSPSEHTFNGTRFPLELHLVHTTADESRIAVVGILYRYGLADPFISRLFPFITSLRRSDIPVGRLNPESIGFPGRRYYRYHGSLTAPPCTEGVVWTVFQQVKTVTRNQVEALRNVLPPQNRNNSRPTQPLNNRTVLLYDPARRS